MEEVTFNSIVRRSRSDVELRGTLSQPIKDHHGLLPAILVVHGWCGTEVSYLKQAQEIANLGAIVLTFNLRGHGNSQGNLKSVTLADFVDDVVAAYDFLFRWTGVDFSRIAGLGSSMGCYLLTRLLATRHIDALALLTPATYPDQCFYKPFSSQINESLKRFRRRRIHPSENLGLQSLSRFKGDALLISGGRDEDVPKQAIENYAEAAQQAKTLTSVRYTRMGHRPTIQQSGWINTTLRRWFTQWISH